MRADALQKKTAKALLFNNLLTEPLFTLYGFLAFILYKDLGASPLQIALLTALKPVITLLSFYWSANLKGRSQKLKSNVLWAGFFMRAPFLLCFWFDSPFFMIAAAVNYMFFYRAAIPAWLEILKRNMDASKRSKAFSLSSAIGYIEGVLLAIGCGACLDHNPACWKILFVSSALIGLLSLFIQAGLPIQEADPTPIPSPQKPNLKELLIRPWKDSYDLIRKRADFSSFQWGFMISGFGLMLIQPALPIFMVDVLNISYLEMTSAISIAKGLGFALSSPFWARWMDRFNIFKMASFVFLSIGLFTLLLGLASIHIVWFYIAYFWYGIGQGGSHLVWNMSGPIFSQKEESSQYSGVNVAMAGLRGAVAPPIGSFCALLLGPVQILLIGGFFCFYSGLKMLRSKFAKDPLSINI